MLLLTNPRTGLDSSTWPIADSRGICRFQIRRNSKGLERIEKRVNAGRVRFSPWGVKVRIVDGADGLTYVVGKIDHDCYFLMSNRMREVEYYQFSESPIYQEIKRVLG